MCLTRVTRENFTGFPREIHMLLLVGRTRPNADDRLGCTTYRAPRRVDLLIHTSSYTSTCGYVGADATICTLALFFMKWKIRQQNVSTNLKKHKISI